MLYKNIQPDQDQYNTACNGSVFLKLGAEQITCTNADIGDQKGCTADNKR